MVLIRSRRAAGVLILTGAVASLLAACGNKSSGNNGTATPPPPINSRLPTPTRTATRTATDTPTDTPTPTATFVPIACTPSASGCIPDVVGTIRNAQPGSTITFPGGPYEPLVLQADDVHGPLTLLADVTAQVGGGTAAPAVVDARGGTAAITLIGVADLVIDGFTVTGGTLAGIRVLQDSTGLGSTGITIRNCVIRGSARDGVAFERSSNSLVFNNLLYQHRGAGLSAVGTSDLRIINNTIYGNNEGGVIIGDSLLPSALIRLENNIITANTPLGIIVGSTTDYSGNYNLNTDGYGSGVMPGSRDLNTDPLFNNPTTDDGFHVAPTNDSCIGGSPTIDAGNPDTDGGLIDQLIERTTQTDDRLDCLGLGCCPVDCDDVTVPCTREGQLDLGYHFLPKSAFTPPTPPRPPTNTPRRSPGTAIATPTGPTRTPTHTLLPGAPTATPRPGVPTHTPTISIRPTHIPTRTPLPR